MQTKTVKIPGKLMIAGEHAVLEPYQPLIVMAVNRYVYTKIEANKHRTLTLESFALTNMMWSFENGEMTIDTEDERINFVQNAFDFTLGYLYEKDVDIPSAKVTIWSELNDDSGKKYGLGSSAAVTVSVVSAILHYYLQKAPDKEVIFKLAAMAHVRTQGSGSGADIAASTFGGYLKYSSFQAEWLLKFMEEEKSLVKIVESDWRYLSHSSLSLPVGLRMYVGWTGNPASTTNLVSRVRELKNSGKDDFVKFIHESRNAVDMIALGFETGNIDMLFDGVKYNRQILAGLGRHADVELETPLLGKLADIASENNGAGKFSGAGGGDCGIAFLPEIVPAKRMLGAWERVGIKPLSLKVDMAGVSVVE